jgi:MarR family 2-MHQ and catechol resistance regulon transcriptional repressor
MRDELLQQLGETLERLGKSLTKEYGDSLICLSPALDHVVLVLGSEGEMNVKQLAQYLLITPGAVTQQIVQLETEGLVGRTANPQDRRETFIQLTIKGQAIYETIRNNHQQVLAEAFADLAEDELEQLVSLISKASQRYDKKENKE